MRDVRDIRNTRTSLSLAPPISGSDFPLPTLYSSSPIMPEEVSMTPMNPSFPSENQSINM